MRYNSGSSRFLGIIAVLAALLLGAGPASAQNPTSSWTSAGGGSYTNDANWDLDAPLNLTGTNAMFGLQGSSYTVTFETNTASRSILMTGTSQTVTFDLGGNTHLVGVQWDGVDDIYVTNSTWVIENGRVGTAGDGSQYRFANDATLVITNGGKLLGGYLYAYTTNTVLVSGAGSQLYNWHGGTVGGPLIISNGAAVTLRSMDLSIDTTVDGAVYTNYTRFLTYGGNTTRLRNGAEMVTTGLGGTTLGIQSGNSSRLIVGSATGLSGWTADGITHEEWYSVQRGDTEVIVSTNGYVKPTNVSPYPMYTTGSYVTVASSGVAAWRVQDNSMITLRGGTILMNTNAVLGLTDNNANTSPGFSTEAGTAILRGYGTISNYNAGANFRVLNHGVIRPGDIGVESGVISSNIVGMGAINIVGGDLLMTNASSYVGSAIHFDFSDTALDQILISGGSALITGGSNIFTLAAGSAPLGPYKWGLGAYDFITGTNIVWSPEYANLTSILTSAGLTEGLHYSFGIVGIGGGLQALRLEFVPEPSTALLLLGGGLVLLRLRRRR